MFGEESKINRTRGDSVMFVEERTTAYTTHVLSVSIPQTKIVK